MTEPTFKITLAQLNPTVGDVAGNAAKARAARDKAKADGADLLVLPELFVTGYPPEDLVLKPAFQAACRAAVEELARETKGGGPAMLIGTPWVEDGKLYNACALLDQGRISALRFKANLPNYGVFDEKRLFARGPAAGPVTVKGIRVGVPICEDIWLEESEEYENVVECLAETGAEILVVPNGSPYARDKNDLRLSIGVARVTESGLTLVYLNQIGGQDELVVDGASFALNADLSVAAQLPAFEESIVTLQWTKGTDGWRCSGPVVPLVEGDKGDYAACVLGLRDYVRKNGFPGVLLGVSGGIDSALCAAIAVDALGAAKVRGVMLPACSACAITSARMDSPACCSVSPAASIRRCARRSRWMRLAPTRCAASCCLRARLARLRPQEWIPRRAARCLRRHRFGAVRGDRGGCAWRRKGARRHAACVLGLRDYVRKNGFPGVLLGVSGGIDSALCAAIAVDALGADKVRGVMLPACSACAITSARMDSPACCSVSPAASIRRCARRSRWMRLAPTRCAASCCLRARLARLRPQEWIPRRAARCLRRHRFGAVRGDRGGCAWRRQGARRHAACVLGLRDYVRKNGFPGVLLGVSGGIDSALCAAIAVDALGANNVRGVMLPFRFTAQVSLDDAAKLAKALGFPYEVLPIADAVNGSTS